MLNSWESAKKKIEEINKIHKNIKFAMSNTTPKSCQPQPPSCLTTHVVHSIIGDFKNKLELSVSKFSRIHIGKSKCKLWPKQMQTNNNLKNQRKNNILVTSWQLLKQKSKTEKQEDVDSYMKWQQYYKTLPWKHKYTM